MLVNELRAESDLPPVLADADLTAAARAHSEDMAEGGFCAHEGSDGRDVAERLTAFGFAGRRHGEVVSCRTDSPAEAMAQWLGSPGHRAIILEERFTLAGAGVASTNGTGSMWTMTFGAD